ncbi:Cytochrome c oxidase assembly factor 4-like protein, mitochondrial [Platysternon megacephalum]|uniref:Cytochrome c oxidase assembly factor 4-like protein, mitochondrial n=1 Tax=Platysternon megacephalum TaxID=55544 RepID=A0A4D9E3C0_9SAUR|nr:Cytochrome c oxidase assembly factor 4-like protein, mitochondrial [Platysternon megacephalum]
MSGPSPQGHNWSQKSEDEEDPLDQMILRTGCATFHYAVQECMAEHQDWRKCQQQVQAFKDCMKEHQKQRMEELQKRQRLARPRADRKDSSLKLKGSKSLTQPEHGEFNS